MTAFNHVGVGNVQLVGASPGASMLLQTGFSKNPGDFSHLRIVQRVPTARNLFAYGQMNAADVARIQAHEEDPNWADGTNRPVDNKFRFKRETDEVERDSENSRLGNQTIDQNDIQLVAAYNSGHAHRAMLKKSRSLEKLITDPAKMTDYEPSAVTAIGGKVNAGTSSAPYFQRMCNWATTQIIKATNGAVMPGQIYAKMGLETAQKIAGTAETQNWLTDHDFSIAALRNDPGFELFGLPPILHGVRICVAAESLVTSAEQANEADETRRMLYQGLGSVGGVTVNDAIVFGVRQGESLQPIEVARNLGTGENNAVNLPGSHTSFYEVFHEDMTVEQKVDDWNRVTQMGVANSWKHVIGSPNSCLLFRDVLG